ncbi:hypothetical protein RRG08_026862 [Elysia crispata]|uniref:Secreted protein n=1 Tax=Elysia crispata TaxID=231223 RepID=A0AAE0Y5Z6_9GAST|nr:hypothetical protein RRG08_026862 [Elysia crispata]
MLTVLLWCYVSVVTGALTWEWDLGRHTARTLRQPPRTSTSVAVQLATADLTPLTDDHRQLPYRKQFVNVGGSGRALSVTER